MTRQGNEGGKGGVTLVPRKGNNTGKGRVTNLVKIG